MEKIVCEMCGNNNLIKQDGVYVCESCGTKYTLEEAKKLLNVKIDNSEEESNLFKLATDYYEKGNLEKTVEFCEKVLAINSNNEKASAILTICQKQLETNTKTCFWVADMTSDEALEGFNLELQKLLNKSEEPIDAFYNELGKTTTPNSIKSKIKILSKKSEYYLFSKMDGRSVGSYTSDVDYKTISGNTGASKTEYHCYSETISNELETKELNWLDYENYAPNQAALFEIDKSSEEIFTKFSYKLNYNALDVLISLGQQNSDITRNELDKSTKKEDCRFRFIIDREFYDNLYFACKRACPGYINNRYTPIETVVSTVHLWMPIQIINFEYEGIQYKAFQYLVKDYPRVFTTMYTGDTVYRNPEFVQAYIQGNKRKMFQMAKEYETSSSYTPSTDRINMQIEKFEKYNKQFLKKTGIVSKIDKQNAASNSNLITKSTENQDAEPSSNTGYRVFLFVLAIILASLGGLIFVGCIISGELLVSIVGILMICGAGAVIKASISNKRI